MRKAAGITLIYLGVIGFAICGIVLLRLPIPGVVLRNLSSFGFHVHPVEGRRFPLIDLCFEHVDTLGAYSIPSETGLLISSDCNS
ncbi:MAG: hypothetical protein DMG78_12175 [Acidobacteria bacterium]|nr:MAG: hypothetical protein DMG78_12175 [Acidobacteriota bacterium]